MKFIIILLSLTAVSASVSAQKLLYKYEDIANKKVDPNAYDITTRFLSDKLTVHMKDKTTKVIPRSSVWGYEDRHHQIFRLYSYSHVFKNSFVLIKERGPLFIYDTQGKGRRYLFSKTGGSEIMAVTKENLENAYSENACFVEKIKKVKDSQINAYSPRLIPILDSLYRSCK